MKKHLWDKKKRIAFIGLVTLFACGIIIISYLYTNNFEIEYEPQTLSQLWKEKGFHDDFVITGKRVEADISKNVINTELMLSIRDLQKDIPYHIDQVDLDVNHGRLKINGKLFGISFPLSILFEPVADGNVLRLPFTQIKIGKQGIPLSKTQSDRLGKYLLKGQESLTLDFSTRYHTNLLSIRDVFIENGGIKLGIEANDKLIKLELSGIKSDLNKEILSKFENSQDLGEKRAAYFIQSADNLTDEDIQTLIQDAISNSKIAGNILICANQNVFENILEKYGDLFKNFDRADLMKKKGILLTQILKPYNQAILGYLTEEYFLFEPVLINKGQPYLLSKKIGISLQKIAKEKEILVPASTLEKMDFCYDYENELLLVSYKLDKDLYLLMHDNEYRFLDEKTYQEKYSYESTGRADYVKDIKTWNAIMSELSLYFQTDEIYIRYMMTDNEYGFVIASPKYNYQSYWAFAFKKEGEKWEILEENVDKLQGLNRKHPSFNLETATLEIETVTMYNLPEDMYDVILEDMLDKEMIQEKERLEIEYCSYGNQYIDFMLSDGQEYVYLVTGVYLNKVLKKEEALESFKDLPDIITLQNPPES